jgi:hypothetical protein
MTAKTNYLEDRVLDRVLRNNADFAYTFPATVYAALFTADPGEAGTLTSEVSGGSYARQSVAFSAISTGTGTTSNASLVTFPTASASWGTVTHVGIMDASTAGNMLYFGALTASKTVGSGDVVSIQAAAISVSET